MIEIIDGVGVGSGKSYYVCTRILEHLARGGTVFAADTYGLKFEESRALCRERYGVEVEDGQYNTFPEEDIARLHEVTPRGADDCPVLVVVDEAQGMLNARDWSDMSKRGLFNWLTQSRHDDTDVIFISQSANNIDKQVRRLVSRVVRMRNCKTSNLPLFGSLPLFRRLMLDADGSTLLEGKWVRHDKAIFHCYTSKSRRGKHKRAGDVPRRKLKKTKKTDMKSIAIIFALLCAFALYQYFGRDKPLAAVALPTPKAQPQFAQDKPTLREVGPPPPAFELAVENFRGFVAAPRAIILRTDQGSYTLGRFSRRGLVVAIDDRTARVEKPGGGQVLVYAEEVGGAAPAPSVAAPGPVTPTPQESKGPWPAFGPALAQAGLPATEEDADRLGRIRAGLPPKEKVDETAKPTEKPPRENRRN